MRRLLPLLTLIALAAPASAAAQVVKPPPPLRDDATAMKTVSQAAVKVEKCRSKTIDYLACDTRAEAGLPATVQVEAATMRSYTIFARSRQGRRFTIDRASGALTATCTPAGRGRCGPAGTWKPKPKPVMSPAWGTEWLAHERELTAQILRVAEMIDRCHAGTGDYTPCETPELELAARWGAYEFELWLRPDGYRIGSWTNAMTEFSYERMADGSVHRYCRLWADWVVSPCDGERW